MAEEDDETPVRPGMNRPGEPRPDLTGRKVEGDLLAERRALRAAEAGEGALVRRAEAAEATVETLERHVASLQQRLAEADEERGRLGELLDAERTVAIEREHELRRVKQREYAEQQLRVEAEERLVGTEREQREEVERLAGRLEASERQAAQLARRLEQLRRQLSEAEQDAAAERASVGRAQHELRVRLDALEARAGELQRALYEERAARASSERLLAAIGEGHRRMEGLVGEIKEVVSRLAGALAAPQPPAEAPRAHRLHPAAQQAPPEEALGRRAQGLARDPTLTSTGAGQARGEEMAVALAGAVERLRARAEAAAGPAGPPEARATPAAARVPHKHSMSLIGRWRMRRKQRRSR